MKQYLLAILGFGTVGTGVYRILTENHGDLMHRESLDLCVSHILVRDIERASLLGLAPRALFTTDYDDILSDASVSVVVECMGGVEPAGAIFCARWRPGKQSSPPTRRSSASSGLNLKPRRNRRARACILKEL